MLFVRNIFYLCFCVFGVLHLQYLHSQTFVYTSMSPINLVNNVLLGDGMVATNITFKNPTTHTTNANITNLKKFTATSPFPFSEGVFIKTDGGVLGDVDLTLLANSMNLGNITNGGILEFDFVAQGTELSFDYMFASSEYQNYTCSSFNDVFAFFLSGPGISGTYSNGAINLATVPNSSPPIPIVVNSINSGNPSLFYTPANCLAINPNYANDAQYWTNVYGSYGNALGGGMFSTQFNGGTVVLTAEAGLICGETYHIKMAIANIIDESLDSGVFLKAKSFVTPPSGVISVVKDIETQKDCVSDSIEFNIALEDNADYESVEWNFGDPLSSDNTSTLDNPKHKFSEAGVYTVKAICYSPESPCNINDTLILELTVHDYIRNTVEVNLCYGEYYTKHNGIKLTSSGTYFDTIPSTITTECDEIKTVVLTIPTQELTLNVTNVQHVSCWGNNDGSIKTEVKGGVSPYTYKWSSPSFSNLEAETTEISDLFIGMYQIKVTDAHNCTTQHTIEITQPDKLILTLSADTTICPYDKAKLSGTSTGGTNPLNIDWGNGQTTWNISSTPAQDTIFKVVVVDKNSCTDTAQVAVKVVKLPIVSFPKDPIIGCVPMGVSLKNLSSGIWDNCKWTFSDGTTITNCDVALHQITEIGKHGVTLTLNTIEGCTISHTEKDFIQTELPPKAEFYADKYDFIVLDENVPEVNFTNTSQYATNYSWSFGDGSTPSYEEHTWHTFPEKQGHKYLVTLTAYNDIGCFSTDQKIIIVREPQLFFVPNTFTPNDDPYNSYYMPIISSGIDPIEYSFKIYDRWGNIIFQTENILQGWDGRNDKGQNVQQGAYIWEIYFLPNDLSDNKNKEKQTTRGFVNLIR